MEGSLVNERIAVIIATAGRRTVIEQMLPYLIAQDAATVDVFVVAPDEASLPRDLEKYPGVTSLISPRGLTKQRNFGLHALSDSHKYVFFFDDDALPHSAYVTRSVDVFDSNPDIVAITGNVVIDGAALDREVSVLEAQQTIAVAENAVAPTVHRSHRDLYGCNFAVRREIAMAELFDERLPLYGWLEDQDFARRVLRHGKIAMVDSALVAHLATLSGGRTDHLRFGYWQVSNPVHLMMKGSFGAGLTLKQVVKPLSANLAGAMLPRGKHRRLRLRGNVRAITDILLGRVSPERALISK